MVVEGFTESLNIATLRINGLIYPSYTGSFDPFLLEVVEKGTYNILKMSDYIYGPVIGPGMISEVQILGSPLHLSVEGSYTFSFKTHGDIPSGGYIIINFPVEYQGAKWCKVNNGLSPLKTVICKTTGNTLRISDFSTFTAGVINLEATVKNPASSGTTSNFKIASYSSNGKMIDQNTEAGTIKLSGIKAPNQIDIEMFKMKSIPPLGKFAPIEFYLQTRQEIPITDGSTSGKIIIYLPVGTRPPQVATESQDYTRLACLFGSDRIPASECSFTAGSPPYIAILTPSTHIFGQCPLAITITTIGGPNTAKSGFMISTGGHKTFTVEVHIDDGSGAFVFIETMSFNYIQEPRELGSESDDSSLDGAGSAAISLLHYSINFDNTITISIENALPIPAGGGLEIDFITSNFGFSNTLGTDLLSFNKINYECNFDSVVWGADAYCELTAGTPFVPAKVRLISPTLGKTVGASTDILFYWVKNNRYVGYTPKAVIKTIDADGVALEYKDVEGISVLKQNSANCAAGASTLTATQSSPESLNAQYSFDIDSSESITDGDKLMIIIPNVFKIITAGGLSTCGGSNGLNVIGN